MDPRGARGTGICARVWASRVGTGACLQPHPGGEGALRRGAGLRPALWGSWARAAMTVAIGLLAGPVMDYASAAAGQRAAPQGYIDAVLGTPAR